MLFEKYSIFVKRSGLYRTVIVKLHALEGRTEFSFGERVQLHIPVISYLFFLFFGTHFISP